MYEIILRISHTDLIATEIILDEFGACSVSMRNTEDHSLFAEGLDKFPLWKKITLTALFENDIDTVALRDTLEIALNTSQDISKQVLEPQHWQLAWKQGLKPMQFGKRFWICPSCFTAPDPFAINIRLDPGLAFGTGTHPTTALCLEWLAENAPINKFVIDFGCGSGILAMTAYFLGANGILAIDHDPLAIEAAKQNAAQNNIPEHTINFVINDQINNQVCDVLLANVLLNPLLHIKTNFATCLRKDGKILLSGILEQQLDTLSQSYESHFKFDRIHSKDKWVLIEASHL